MYKRSVSGMLRYTARLVLAGSIALAALGCSRPLAPIPDVPRRQGKALRVFVDNLLPRGIITRTTVDAKTGIDPFLALANDLQTALEQAGYVVVRDPEQPHDVTARLTSDTHWENLSDTTGRFGSYGTTKLQFFASSPGGRSHVLDEVSVTVPVSDGGTVLAASFSTFVSRRLVEQVELSTNIATMSPAGIAPRPAVASSDPVPTPSTAALTTPPSARAAADSAPPPAAVLTSASPQPSAWALIIGIEKYRDVPPPTGARSDAEGFAQMARHTLGIPESHIVVALDDRASKSDIEKHLDWLKANVPAGARIYFYFSGHGAPEPSKGTSYLFPFDGDPRFLEKTALPMGDVLRLLSQTKAREVLAVVDACFSGAGGRSVLPPGARALVRVQTAPITASVALFSGASGAEISGPAPGSSSGLFTQHVLEGLGRGKADMDGDGQVSLQELSDYVRPRVARDAKRDNRDQNPSLTVGNTVGSADKFIVEWGLAAAR